MPAFTFLIISLSDRNINLDAGTYAEPQIPQPSLLFPKRPSSRSLSQFSDIGGIGSPVILQKTKCLASFSASKLTLTIFLHRGQAVFGTFLNNFIFIPQAHNRHILCFSKSIYNFLSLYFICIRHSLSRFLKSNNIIQKPTSQMIIVVLFAQLP